MLPPLSQPGSGTRALLELGGHPALPGGLCCRVFTLQLCECVCLLKSKLKKKNRKKEKKNHKQIFKRFLTK